MQKSFLYSSVANQSAMFGDDVSRVSVRCKLQSCDSFTFEYRPDVIASAILRYFKQSPKVKVTPTEEIDDQYPEKKKRESIVPIRCINVHNLHIKRICDLVDPLQTCTVTKL